MKTQCDDQRFIRDVAKHQLTIIRDDGLYRHIRLSVPGSRCMLFDLVTWPGHLCYTGDMGTYVFSRIPDMFAFFRSREGRDLDINPSYWSEKAEATDKGSGIKEFSEDKFNAAVMSHLVEWIRNNRYRTTKDERRELWVDVVHEVIRADGDSGGHRKQAAVHDFSHRVNNDVEFYFKDFWEASVEVYTFHYIWCCYAMNWGVAQYDAHKKSLEAD